MKNKILIYLMVFLVAFVIFAGGYYSAIFFEKIDSNSKELAIEHGQETTKAVETIREDPFLIHGFIQSIGHGRGFIESRDFGQGQTVISVFINANENFKFPPFLYITREFLIEEESIINTAQRTGYEMPITVLEDSIENVNDSSILKEGDLVVIKSTDYFDDIFSENLDFYYSIAELWKITE